MEEKCVARKKNRLESYDYSSNGAYFITVCVKDMECLLSEIVGVGVPDDPKVYLTDYGKIINNRILKMDEVYSNINVERYVIMPNHMHILLSIVNGSSGTPTPTHRSNSALSSYVSTLKRITNKEIGESIWQRGFYDHIIRGEEDLYYHLRYIDENPKKWLMGKDKYYS